MIVGKSCGFSISLMQKVNNSFRNNWENMRDLFFFYLSIFFLATNSFPWTYGRTGYAREWLTAKQFTILLFASRLWGAVNERRLLSKRSSYLSKIGSQDNKKNHLKVSNYFSWHKNWKHYWTHDRTFFDNHQTGYYEFKKLPFGPSKNRPWHFLYLAVFLFRQCPRVGV